MREKKRRRSFAASHKNCLSLNSLQPVSPRHNPACVNSWFFLCLCKMCPSLLRSTGSTVIYWLTMFVRVICFNIDFRTWYLAPSLSLPLSDDDCLFFFVCTCQPKRAHCALKYSLWQPLKSSRRIYFFCCWQFRIELTVVVWLCSPSLILTATAKGTFNSTSLVFFYVFYNFFFVRFHLSRFRIETGSIGYSLRHFIYPVVFSTASPETCELQTSTDQAEPAINEYSHLNVCKK